MQRVSTRILFVCLGNICRSPTAEATMRRLASEAGLDGAIALDSAGTGSWHLGEPPDERATQAAACRGLELGGAARQVGEADFANFDLLIAMDRSNLRALRLLAPDEESADRARLLRTASGAEIEVPDPYYGGAEGFDEVLDVVEEGCRALLAELEAGLRA
jgi:protein-tyrosine phosphatase